MSKVGEGSSEIVTCEGHICPKVEKNVVESVVTV